MPLVPAQNRLRITRAPQELMRAWAEGVHLEHATGRDLRELRELVVRDRIELASYFLSRGRRLIQATDPDYRNATSRLYYSMYHAMRAAVYYVHEGDDHQAHSVLPGHAPAAFPNRNTWSNRLKSARAHRNEADYDPYPKSVNAWRTTAEELEQHAGELLRVTRAFLRGLGCTLR